MTKLIGVFPDHSDKGAWYAFTGSQLCTKGTASAVVVYLPGFVKTPTLAIAEIESTNFKPVGLACSINPDRIRAARAEDGLPEGASGVVYLNLMGGCGGEAVVGERDNLQVINLASGRQLKY
ncbi:MAG: hypothetical protein AB7G06_04265 [Bdellovibrionales bacterium]